LVVKMNGSAAPFAVASLPQKSTPPVVDFTSQLAALRLRTAREVVVALVDVALIVVRLVIVEEAVERRPLENRVSAEKVLLSERSVDEAKVQVEVE